MRRTVVVIVIFLGCVWPASAKSLRTTGDEIFCLNARDLVDFAATFSIKDETNEGVKKEASKGVPGCLKLRKGVRYTVLSDEPDRPDRVRLEWGDRRGGGAVEGYMISLGK